jgi:putative ABC transport system permease protein
MFKARTSRTLLTILGMGIGISAVLFLVSFGYGLQKTLLERITTSDSLLTLDVTEAKSGAIGLDTAMIEKIQNLPGVEEVSPSFQLTAQGHSEAISADLSAVGVKPSFLRLGGYRIISGETLKDEKPNGAVVTSAIGQLFGKKDAAEMIGQEMNFSFFIPKETEVSAEGGDLQSNLEKVESNVNYKIVGIIEGEENTVYINSQSTTDLKISRFSQVKVKCHSQSDMSGVREAIEKEGLLVSSISETIDQANQVFRVVQIVLFMFGIIALVVSAIGMFNTMTIALLERTEEIGIMKSIGASDMGISLMFIMESTIMGFLGGLGGVIIGIIGGEVVNRLINFIASRFGGESVRLFYSPLWFVMAIIIFSAFVGFITGFAPARRASKIDPLDALRYK